MAGFDDWQIWALAEPSRGWSNAARQAAVAARYEDPASGESYRSALGTSQPKCDGDYYAVTSPHCLRGATLSAGQVPGAVTRSVRLSSLERHLASAGWSSVDPSYTLADVLPDTLVPLEALVPDPISVRVARTELQAVFVTFTESPLEGVPAPAGSRPPKVLLWEKGRVGESLADTAVDCLALAPRPLSDAECEVWVALHYAPSHCGALRIPVPADGGLHERFRAVEAGSPVSYGRTCGGWTPAPCDPARSEPEVVHANVPIPAAAILVLSLGQTTVARPVLP